MRILVTGGTGFLGKATALRLKASAHDVAVLGRNPKAGAELEKAGIEFIRTDLADKDAVVAACAGVEVVIHCAALASPWGKYDDFYQANVIGTRHVLEGCQRHGVRRLVNISTPSIYFDYRSRTGIKESDPIPKPVTHYASTKLEADQEIEAAAKRGLETIAIRPRAIFGPGDQTILGRMLRQVETGTVPLIDGGNSLIDMTYIDNAVDAIVLCVNAPKAALGKTFNITNGEPISTKKMFRLLCEELGLVVKYRKVPVWAADLYAILNEWAFRIFRRSGEPTITTYAVGLMSRSQTLDISAARAELGYEPKISLQEGFERFASWHRSI